MLLIGKPSINGPFSMAMLNNQWIQMFILLLIADVVIEVGRVNSKCQRNSDVSTEKTARLGI